MTSRSVECAIFRPVKFGKMIDVNLAIFQAETEGFRDAECDSGIIEASTVRAISCRGDKRKKRFLFIRDSGTLALLRLKPNRPFHSAFAS